MTHKLKLQTDGVLEIPIVFNCNLNCNYCSHMSQFMQRIPPISLQAFEQMCKDWTGKIESPRTRLHGGESLLHPDLEEIIQMFVHYWKPATTHSLHISTNGILLDKVPQSVCDLLNEHDITVDVTLHHPSFESICKTALSRFKHTWLNDMSSGDFMRLYEMVDNRPKLYRNNRPGVPYGYCSIKRHCQELIHNKLYHCSLLGWWTTAYKFCIIDDEINYTPATPDMTIDELVAWYNADFSLSCSICPAGNHTVVPLSEIFPNENIT